MMFKQKGLTLMFYVFITCLLNLGFAQVNVQEALIHSVKGDLNRVAGEPSSAFLHTWLYSSAEAETSNLDKQLFERLAAIYQVFKNNPEHIWGSSYLFDQRPLLLVYRDANGEQPYAYLLNHPEAASLPSAELMPSDPALALPEVYKLSEIPDKALLAEIPNFTFQFPIEGTPTFVMMFTTPEVDSYAAPISADWDAFIVHEGFHDQQFDTWENNASDVQDESNYPLSAKDIADIQLETKLLIAALEASDAQARDEALKRFIAVRSQRMEESPIVKGMDGAQERYEGTARYLEHRLAEHIPNPNKLSPVSYLEIDLDPAAKRDQLAFGRFYATGAALSLLLDQLELDWKTRVEAGENQYEILSAHYGLSNDKTAKAELLNDARTAYDYVSLQEAAVETARTVDEGYSPIGADDNGGSGEQYVEIEELVKPYEAVTQESISTSIPEGYVLLGQFSATKNELDPFYQDVYSPTGNPITVIDYGEGENRLRIVSSAYEGTLEQAVATHLINKTQVTIGRTKAALYTYNEADGLYSDLSFVHDGHLYNVAGPLTKEQIIEIAKEIMTSTKT